jgi:uncharacterized membrane protein YuzA (DUF378 family)
MKDIEKIKFICGLILVAFAIIGGLIFFLESFKILDEVLSTKKTSRIWEDGYGEGSGASHTPIFLGLCGLAGAYLLASVRPSKTETKIEVTSDQPTN